MKTILFFLVTFLLGTQLSGIKAQEVTDSTQISAKYYIVIKNDGTEYVGKILKQDEREVLIDTKTIGKLYIPKHEIRQIKEVEPSKLNKDGDIILEESFATRYFITTNGLPISKGDSYIQWNLYGPDFQFALANNLNLGIMTSWVGVPIVGNAKYAINLSKNFHLGLGILAGTGSWAQLDVGGVLPFGCFTYGNKNTNINFSSGYGYVFAEGEGDGHLLLSVSGMTKVSKKIGIVFDSFIFPNINNTGGFGLYIPGLRWQSSSNRAFQFGFAGIYVEGEFIPFTFPMIQWYSKL